MKMLKGLSPIDSNFKHERLWWKIIIIIKVRCVCVCVCVVCACVCVCVVCACVCVCSVHMCVCVVCACVCGCMYVCTCACMIYIIQYGIHYIINVYITSLGTDQYTIISNYSIGR